MKVFARFEPHRPRCRAGVGTLAVSRQVAGRFAGPEPSAPLWILLFAQCMGGVRIGQAVRCVESVQADAPDHAPSEHVQGRPLPPVVASRNDPGIRRRLAPARGAPSAGCICRGVRISRADARAGSHCDHSGQRRVREIVSWFRDSSRRPASRHRGRSDSSRA